MNTPETDKVERMAWSQEYMVDTEFARKLERERDEAREDLEEETKFHHRTHTELIQNQCKLLDMEMQRDEEREKVKQQRTEIVRLNGATSHAGGTPLKIALRERDEEREQNKKLIAEVNDLIKQRPLLIADFKKERDEARNELKIALEQIAKLKNAN